MKLHFKQLGQGEPLVFLHGLFGSSDNWLGIAPKLAENFRVILPDLRNHEASPHAAEMDFPLMAGDVAELLEACNLKQPTIIGHSLGGKVAMQLALSRPELLKALVVVDIAPQAYAPAHNTIFAALRALDLNSFKLRSEIEAAMMAEIPELATRRFLLKNVGSTPEGRFYWKFNLEGVYQNYPRLNEAVVSTWQTTFDKPTLFVRGSKSDYISDMDWPEIQRHFPAAQLVTLPEAGHWVHADAPEDFTAAMQEFLREIR